MTEYQNFFISSPDVVSVRARQDDREDSHTTWFVGYAPEKADELDARVVYGTLHHVSKDAQGDVTVSALFFDGPRSSYDDETIEVALKKSDALETLYDFARTSLRTVLALVGAEASVPIASPEAELSKLVKASDDEATQNVADNLS